MKSGPSSEASPAVADALSHVDANGRAAMVDVGDKAETDRLAIAEAFVSMAGATLAMIRANGIKKGDVLSVARLAGIMGGKKTADLIPLCHPIALSHVGVELTLQDDPAGVHIITRARCRNRTGVEMEALTAASIAALTVYDMAKAVDRAMSITTVRLLRKEGGKSGSWERE